MINRVIGTFRELGLFAGLLYSIDRVLQKISSDIRLFVYEFTVQPITNEALLPPRMARQVEIREIKRGAPEIEMMPARPDIKESRFDQNAICLGAYKNGFLTGYIWFCHAAYSEDEVRCRFELAPSEQAVFDFDLYIFPQYRMGTSFIGLWNGANQYLFERGIRYSYSRVTRSNTASRRAHTHLGCKPVGHAVFFRAGRFQAMASSVFPYMDFSLSRCVRLKLRPDTLHLDRV